MFARDSIKIICHQCTQQSLPLESGFIKGLYGLELEPIYWTQRLHQALLPPFEDREALELPPSIQFASLLFTLFELSTRQFN